MARIKHTHTRKPEPVRAWLHEPGATLPKWAIAGGIHAEDLEREIDGVTVNAVPIGHWLVQNEARDVIVVLSPEQFAAEYDEIAP